MDQDADRLEITIISNKEDGTPVSTVMKHRHKDGGEWHYDSDMDSGEQGGAREMPDLVSDLLAAFGLPNKKIEMDEQFDPIEVANDQEPGMPTIASVQGDASPRITDKNMMGPNMTESNLRFKLEQDLSQLDLHQPSDLNTMLETVVSAARFDTIDECKKYLAEGALLRVNAMASEILGVPVGEYAVYQVASNKSVLFTTVDESDELVGPAKSYEVFTNKIVECWDKLQRSITEADESEVKDDWEGSMHQTQHADTNIKYPRISSIKTAMVNSGMTQRELADACGCHESEISRITAAGKGGRTPSLELAMCILSKTGGDVSMFEPKVHPKRKATSGSGGGRNPVYKQGNKQS